MAKNTSLRKADKAKNDEFYTQLVDIEKELKHYKEFLKGKTVLCNCDDPYESNFFKYFALNFNYLGLKKLITTCYDGSPIVGEQLSLFPEKRAYKIEITEVLDENGDGAVDLSDVEYLLKNKSNTRARLKDGDFRSEECIKLLKEADIVVTNPPFSLFREYVAQLFEYNKKFIIIGNINCITYKEIFPLIKEDKMWAGYNEKGGTRRGNTLLFGISKEYFSNSLVYENDKPFAQVSAWWFTNVDICKRHEELILYKTYTREEYPRYDNYDAINVDKTQDIPYDYDGVMGVPITFLDKYSPKQFEIIDGIGRYSILDNEKTKKEGKYLSMINGVAKYFRVIIKKRGT